MIVHPIGMMRANAAAGLNFVDDFTTYTLGTRMTAHNPPYENVGGFGDWVLIADSGGTRVAQLQNQQETVKFTGGAFAADREISFTIKTLGQTSYVAAYLNYIDGANYIWMTMAADGWLGIEQKVAGSSVFLQPTSGQVTAGDKFTISRVGTTVTVKRNGTVVGTPRTATASTEGQVRFYFADSASPTSKWEISQIEVKDL